MLPYIDPECKKVLRAVRKICEENSCDTASIEEIAERTAFISEHVTAMVEARKSANRITEERAKAIAYHDTVASCFDEIRYHIDKLELVVDDRMWTLPKYRELLYI